MDKLSEILKCVNDRRKELGKPALSLLPKGVRGSVVDCVIAKAISMDEGSVYIPSGKLPDIIYDFIRDFDAGKYPELILQGNTNV